MVWSLLGFAAFSPFAQAQGLQLPFVSGFDKSEDRAVFSFYPQQGNPWEFSRHTSFSSPFSLQQKENIAPGWVVSPMLDFSNGVLISGRYFYSKKNKMRGDTLGIYLGIRGRNPSAHPFMQVKDLYALPPGKGAWQDFALELPPGSDSSYVAFYARNTSGGTVFSLDDIHFEPLHSSAGFIVNSVVEFMNPVPSGKTYRCKERRCGKFFVNLYNAEGKCVFSQPVKKGNFSFDRSLYPGKYLCTLVDASGNLMQKQNLIIIRE
jgi:hypothetical protein